MSGGDPGRGDAEAAAVDATNRLLNGSQDDAGEPTGSEGSDVTRANRSMARQLEGESGDEVARDAALLNPPD